MIKPEMVPDEVVDALLDTSNVAKPWKHALAAALNAWPGMGSMTYDTNPPHTVLILPLMEKRDDPQKA